MADSLLLSLTGILGTLIGSGLTGFLALRSERGKQQALERHEERQSHRQAGQRELDLRLEHHRWSRDHRMVIYQEFAGKVLMARGAALDYHRACVQVPLESEHVAGLRMAGRKAYRDAVMASYGVGLQGPDEVFDRSHDCIASLRDLLNCAERHETIASSEGLGSGAAASMNEQIDVHFNDAQEKLRLFMHAGRDTLGRPMPPT